MEKRTRYARKKYSTTMNHHAYFYLCPTFFRSDDDDENVKFASVRSIWTNEIPSVF